MTTRCIATACERPYIARGLCTLHYQRWQVDRSLPALDGRMPRGKKPIPALERFIAKVAFGEHWVWMAVRTEHGYGVFSGNQAHRWAYEQWVGSIPEGFVIDHLCRIPSCVHPDHLEAVTQRENLRRSNNFMAQRLGA